MSSTEPEWTFERGQVVPIPAGVWAAKRRSRDRNVLGLEAPDAVAWTVSEGSCRPPIPPRNEPVIRKLELLWLVIAPIPCRQNAARSAIFFGHARGTLVFCSEQTLANICLSDCIWDKIHFPIDLAV